MAELAILVPLSTATENQIFLNSVSEKIYSFQNVNENFMNNDIWTQAMHEIIESLETRLHVTETLDKLYEKSIKAICYEMDEYLESKYVSPKSKKCIKTLNHTGMMT